MFLCRYVACVNQALLALHALPLDLHKLLLETALPLELVLTSPPATTEARVSSLASAPPLGNTCSNNMCASLNQMLVILHISHTVAWSAVFTSPR